MKNKTDFNQIKKTFTQVCRQNGLLKDHIINNFMLEFIQKHSNNVSILDENATELNQNNTKNSNILEEKPLSC